MKYRISIEIETDIMDWRKAIKKRDLICDNILKEKKIKRISSCRIGESKE